MSSGFSGGFPDFFNINGGGGTGGGGNRIYNEQMNYRSPLASILSDISMSSSPLGGSRSDLIGKRSFAEFQQQQQQQLRQDGSVYLRNVKPKAFIQQSDFLISPEVSSVSRYGGQFSQELQPICYNNNNNNYQINNNSVPPAKEELERKMMNRLQEIEKELLLDDDEEEEVLNDDVSAVTNTDWSETIQNLLNNNNNNKTFSPSPTTSSSSSCTSTSTAVSLKQLISDAGDAITDGKTDTALEIITRLNQFSNARGTPEQRLGFYMASALKSRVSSTSTQQQQQSCFSAATEIYKKEHILSTQLLYDKSPCFKLAFMAANTLIMKTVTGLNRPDTKIHVVDFDIGHGLQYVYLLHEIAAARKAGKGKLISLKLTTFKDFGNGGFERLKLVGDGLKTLSLKLGVLFHFNFLEFKLSDLNKEGLMVENDEVLAVNLAFKLNKLPDESVTTENLRDEVLRRVKGLSPAVVTVIEQELNANTCSFTARVNELFSYYTTFLDSFDATTVKDSSERVKVEEGLSRRIVNSVTCEGKERVERCEVFGKWRARMSMAGFILNSVSQLTVESLMTKLNSGARGNPGFTVKEYSGGVSFGWLGRTLTVVSAWN